MIGEKTIGTEGRLGSSASSIDFGVDQFPGQKLHETIDELRQRGPIVSVKFSGMPAWLIVDHKFLNEAFHDNDNFPPHMPYQLSIEPVLGETFQTMQGDRHRFYRKLATPTFRPRSIERMDSTTLVDVANELIETFIDNREVDLVAEFTQLFPFAVIANLLGIPQEEKEQFYDWTMAILRFNSDPDRAFHCRDELWNYLDPVIEERRKNPDEDVISHLIHDELQGIRMNNEQIKAHIGIMFTAGSSTTHDSLGNILYALLKNTENWRLVSAKPELRARAIEETLRWEPAVSVLPRMSRSDRTIRFGGVDIEPNSLVLFGICAANHDATIYKNPHEYIIQRDTGSMMTFGPGPRMCPGMHLARKELAVTLDLLTEHFPNLKLVDVDSSKPCGTVFRGPERLICQF